MLATARALIPGPAHAPPRRTIPGLAPLLVDELFQIIANIQKSGASILLDE